MEGIEKWWIEECVSENSHQIEHRDPLCAAFKLPLNWVDIPLLPGSMQTENPSFIQLGGRVFHSEKSIVVFLCSLSSCQPRVETRLQ